MASVDPLDPSFRSVGPAENSAARDAGGGGTSFMFAGFNPTMASVVSAGASGPAPMAGVSDETAGFVRSSGRRGGTTKPFDNAATSRGAAAPGVTSGADGSATGAVEAFFTGGGTKSRGRGREAGAAKGRAFASTTTSRVAGASGSRS